MISAADRGSDRIITRRSPQAMRYATRWFTSQLAWTKAEGSFAYFQADVEEILNLWLYRLYEDGDEELQDDVDIDLAGKRAEVAVLRSCCEGWWCWLNVAAASSFSRRPWDRVPPISRLGESPDTIHETHHNTIGGSYARDAAAMRNKQTRTKKLLAPKSEAVALKCKKVSRNFRGFFLSPLMRAA